jgi:DNA-binding FadR family transcriptional regulator
MAMKGLNKISRSSVCSMLQERIKEYVVANDLKPGDGLPTEAQLAEQLGVSRAVVREGLRGLESLGVVYSRQGEGHYVSRFSLDPIVQNLGYSMLTDVHEVLDVLAVRQNLEQGFIEEAIRSLDERSLAEMEDLVAQMHARAAAGTSFLNEDIAFHRVIYRAIDNALLLKLLDVFWEVYQIMRDKQVLDTPSNSPRDLGKEVQNHVAILTAIRARDVADARARIAHHFDGIRERLLLSPSATGSSAASAAAEASGPPTA